jgi:NADH:ubiquinone oxidoreductase subunit 6 (subunit J)
MTGIQYIFYFFALVTVVSATIVLLTKNVIHAVLALLGVFLGISALYVFAGADFLAISQLIVYIGGVLVLMLFGVMLTNKETNKSYPVSGNTSILLALSVAVLTWIVLLYLVIKDSTFIRTSKMQEIDNTVSYIGISLIKDYTIAFELIGFLLLIALIGAAFIAGKKRETK